MLRVIHHKGIFVLFTVAALTAIIFVNVTQANFQSEGVHYWEARYEGPAKNEDEAKAIAVDGSGNVYITGRSEGIETYYDYATIKYDTDDNQLWVTRYEPPTDQASAGAIAVDGSGNVYVTGGSESIGDNNDITTIKYDTNGNELWVKHYNGPGNDDDGGTAIAVDGSGNLYVTGPSPGIGTRSDYATIKYDTDGNELWVARYNGQANDQDAARDIALDGSGMVYVTGYSIGGSGTYNDYLTVSYDKDGNQVSLARYNHPDNTQDKAYAIALDSSGNVYVTGRSGWDYLTIRYPPWLDPTEYWTPQRMQQAVPYPNEKGSTVHLD